jgi:transglutaminase-like putative cysteine protease
MRRRLPALLAVAVVVAAVAGLALAQRTKRVLHQDLPALATDRPGPMIGQTGSGNPAAFTAGDKVVPKPPLHDPLGKDPKSETVLGTDSFAADRQTTMTPDTNTGPDSTLHYVSVFNPDVLPFKRMSAFDDVSTSYQLGVARTALTELRVGGVTDKTRDRFWGSVLIKLDPGKDIPLPSVAPDMRILSYEIKPKTTVRFSKDGADNFFVRSDESSASGTYRLVFLADADAGYFAPSLPTGGAAFTPRVVATMTPPELRPRVPDAVRRNAKITLDKLNLDAATDLSVAFNKLVGYFRAFTAKPMSSTGDIYRDLCDSQAGVCRHRAFAFMITANALGIPTRFVQNEAHAFVEVWFPERQWQRIDLGGAALRMEVTGAKDKTLHRPRTEDPFVKPPAYRDNYTQLEGEISGLSQQQIADKRKPLDQSPPSGDFSGNTGGGSGAGPDESDTRILPGQDLEPVKMDPKKRSPSSRSPWQTRAPIAAI